MPNPSLSKADQKNVWSAKVMVKKENSVVCQIFYKRRQSRKILNIQKKNCAKEIKKICVHNNLGPTKTFGSEQTLKSQKHLGLKKIWVQNNLGEEKKMVHENIWV